ncbi:MAG TPA: ion channel [Blastocatellia bacterium]|nr:ion channel [Blastocatellia bacterium]
METQRLSPPQVSTGQNQADMRDLGFGSVVARESRQRLLNRDGSFNVMRAGLGFLASLSPYHALLTMSWRSFFGLTALFYFGANLLFAAAYLLCGHGALSMPAPSGIESHFLQAFFFSIHTLATIGYGTITPVGIAANVIVSIESFIGLFGLALCTSLLFARFSRPTAKILFSDRAVIAPYRGITAFEFRIANARRNQIIELEAEALFARFEEVDGRPLRRFYPLKLERDRVVFFPLSWTIVHPIDETSPFYGMSAEDLRMTRGEFLVLLTGFDETFSQTVHGRSSYLAEEVVWNARFADIFNRPSDDGLLTIDVRKLHSIELVKTDQ